MSEHKRKEEEGQSLGSTIAVPLILLVILGIVIIAGLYFSVSEEDTSLTIEEDVDVGVIEVVEEPKFEVEEEIDSTVLDLELPELNVN